MLTFQLYFKVMDNGKKWKMDLKWHKAAIPVEQLNK